ncbi:MAG: PQQ-binding-like beta-propeller repeat protein [Phycisphaerales bacterium]|nr:PQQ-binding-like beta-propeller repeat protein [Phycisphaerales bacterium]
MRNGRQGNFARAVCTAVVFLMISAVLASAQVDRPVYVDDAPRAADLLETVREHAREHHLAEAVRIAQQLIDLHGDQLVAPDPSDPDRFTTVRSAVIELLLDDGGLLSQYRRAFGMEARALLAAGELEALEHRYLLTPAGCEAALRLAQARLEDARFHAALIGLAQLEDHPDRTGVTATVAAQLMVMIASYVDEGRVWETASRWVTDADAPELVAKAQAREAVAPPFSPCVVSPLTAGHDSALDGLLPKPLYEQAIDTDPSQASGMSAGARDEELPRWRRSGQLQSILPTMIGDVLYICDGQSVTAWDRHTMAQRWRYETRPLGEGALNLQVTTRYPRLSESPLAVTAADDAVIAPMGMTISRAHWGDPGICCLDARTGELRWRAVPAEFDASLTHASVQGPVIAAEGTVVLHLVCDRQMLRQRSTYLAGLDLRDGTLRWLRALSSVGWERFDNTVKLLGGPAYHAGRVYVMNRQGTIAAVEVETGRTTWLHRFAPRPTTNTPGTMPPWKISTPIVTDRWVITRTPDGSGLVWLDKMDGTARPTIPASRWGEPDYLLSDGRKLYAVGQRSTYVGPLAYDADALPQRLDHVTEPNVYRGRAVIADGALLAPTNDGLRRVDLAGGPARVFALDEVGNVIAVPGQVISVTESRLRNYLSWDDARLALEGKMADRPGDPAPAIAFACLARRIGRVDLFPAAVDEAIDRLARRPFDDASRRAVFDLLIESLESSDMRDQAMGRSLHTRLALVAAEPNERVRHLLLLGRFEEGWGRYVEAADAYQRILAETALRDTPHRTGDDRHETAGEEATGRLITLILRAGRSVYAAHDEEAGRSLDALMTGTGRDADALLALAVRYPLASAAPAALEQAGASLIEQQQRDSALRAYLDAYERYRLVRASDPKLIGRISGGIVSMLSEQHRPGALLHFVIRAQRDHSGIALVSDDHMIDVDALMAKQQALLRHKERIPRLGPVRDCDDPLAFVGWSIMPTVRRPGLGCAEHVMMQSDSDIALFGGAEFRKLWQRRRGAEAPQLVSVDAETILLAHWTDAGYRMESVSALTGAQRWISDPFAELFDAPDDGSPPAVGIQVRVPSRGMVWAGDFVIKTDDNAIVLVRRDGRAVCLDATTGVTIWAKVLPVNRVTDVDMSGDLIAAAGYEGETAPRLIVVDRGTGDVAYTAGDEVTGRINWIHLHANGTLVWGDGGAVRAVDITTGRRRWTNPMPDWRNTRRVWPMDDLLLIERQDRALWLVRPTDGDIIAGPVDTRGPLPAGVFRVLPTPGGFILAARDRVLSYALSGRLVGVDAVAQPAHFIDVASADGMVAVLDQPGAIRPADRPAASLHLLSTASCELLDSLSVDVDAQASAVAVVDGKILVTFGKLTLVFDAPPATW